MLHRSKIVGFVGTAKPEQAKHFYESLLELQLVEDGPFALVFVSGETTIRVQR